MDLPTRSERHQTDETHEGPRRRPRRSDGARTATQRANTIWKRLLAEAVPPPLDDGIVAALDAFVARRKREIAVAG